MNTVTINTRYEVDLNLNEQRMALMTVVDMLETNIARTLRKHGLRDSEKAMSIAAYKRYQIALRMAVERIDAELKAQHAG